MSIQKMVRRQAWTRFCSCDIFAPGWKENPHAHIVVVPIKQKNKMEKNKEAEKKEENRINIRDYTGGEEVDILKMIGLVG